MAATDEILHYESQVRFKKVNYTQVVYMFYAWYKLVSLEHAWFMFVLIFHVWNGSYLSISH